MTENDLRVVIFIWDDLNKLIAAGKVQRWEVLKWVVTVNLALTTASVAIRYSQGLFYIFSLLVAGLGVILLFHYNRRITGARKMGVGVVAAIDKDFPKVGEMVKEDVDRPIDPSYDSEELIVFGIAIFGSTLLPLVSLLDSLTH